MVTEQFGISGLDSRSEQNNLNDVEDVVDSERCKCAEEPGQFLLITSSGSGDSGLGALLRRLRTGKESVLLVASEELEDMF